MGHFTPAKPGHFYRYIHNSKIPKRRNKFAGKEDVSRATADGILSGQIDLLRDVARTSDQAATKLQESVDVLYNKQIPVNTERFEQLNRDFIAEMEHKLRKVKRPSKGLVWYIAMWIITLTSTFTAGYLIYERKELKKDVIYWYQLYEEEKHQRK